MHGAKGRCVAEIHCGEFVGQSSQRRPFGANFADLANCKASNLRGIKGLRTSESLFLRHRINGARIALILRLIRYWFRPTSGQALRMMASASTKSSEPCRRSMALFRKLSLKSAESADCPSTSSTRARWQKLYRQEAGSDFVDRVVSGFPNLISRLTIQRLCRVATLEGFAVTNPEQPALIVT
jgi:hypothetical protein